MKRTLWLIPGFCLLLTALAGCGRIVVLDDPLSPEEHLKLALAYEKKGETDAASREFEKAARDIPLAHLYWGNMLFTLKDYEQAESRYRQAMRLLPDNPEPYNNLAWMLLQRQTRLDEAEKLARRAVDLAPPDKLDDFQDTLERIRQARKKTPGG